MLRPSRLVGRSSVPSLKSRPSSSGRSRAVARAPARKDDTFAVERREAAHARAVTVRRCGDHAALPRAVALAALGPAQRLRSSIVRRDAHVRVARSRRCRRFGRSIAAIGRSAGTRGRRLSRDSFHGPNTVRAGPRPREGAYPSGYNMSYLNANAAFIQGGSYGDVESSIGPFVGARSTRQTLEAGLVTQLVNTVRDRRMGLSRARWRSRTTASSTWSSGTGSSRSIRPTGTCVEDPQAADAGLHAQQRRRHRRPTYDPTPDRERGQHLEHRHQRAARTGRSW